jgi:hypothetical protein
VSTKNARYTLASFPVSPQKINDSFLQFVEDEGDVVFYKNAYGLAKMRPAFSDATASDSGIEIDSK